MAHTKLPIFKTTSGTFTAREVINEGGSGRVYKVEDESGQLFAAKLLKVDKTAPREKLKRFRNGLFYCLKSEHPNIIPIIDHGVHNSGESYSPFYIMPLFTHSLRSLMDSRIAPADVLRLFAQMLDGVEAAHLKGVVYRDLKPENMPFDAEARSWFDCLSRSRALSSNQWHDGLRCRIVVFYPPQVSATVWRIAFVSVSSGQLN